MLYIGNNKIIKGYIGGILVTKVSLGNRELIKLEVAITKSFVPKCTDFSVKPGSTIVIEYTSEGVSKKDITVSYDETFFTRDGDSFTLIAEGYSEITYNIEGLPSVIIRVATGYSSGGLYNTSLSYDSELPVLPNYMVSHYLNFGMKTPSSSTDITNPLSYTALWNTDGDYAINCYGYLNLNMRNLKGSFYVSITYNSNIKADGEKYSIYLTKGYGDNIIETIASGESSDINIDKTVTSLSYSEAGEYKLYFEAFKGANSNSFLLGIRKVEVIFEDNIDVYPATQIVTEQSKITPVIGTNFTIDSTLIPSNANEVITYTHNSTSEYVTKRNNNTFIVWGRVNPFNIECKGQYVSNTVNVDVNYYGKAELIIVYTTNGTVYYPYATDKASDWWETTTSYGSGNSKAIITASTLPTTLKFNLAYNNMSIMSIDYIRTNNITDMSYMFEECYNLTSIGNLSIADTSNVSNMFAMFRNCSVLSWLDLSWSTYNVTDMGSMFENCSGLNELYVSSWDTSNVTNMNWMFSSCSNLFSLDLSNWYTYNVSDMSYMFNSCGNLYELYLSNFDMSNTWTTDGMFTDCYNLTYLHLDYCSVETVDKIINSSDFPVDNYGTIYCSWDVYNQLTPPGNWTFEAV